MQAFLAAMTGRATHRAYDTGHDVDADAQARADRIAFLRSALGLDR